MAKWTPRHEAPEPLEGPVVATVTGGTIIWFALFLVQLPFYGWFADHGHTWWLWTCLAGGGLGLIGIWYVTTTTAPLGRPRVLPKSDLPPTPTHSPGEAAIPHVTSNA
jgi:hypothetical protein